MPVVPDGGGQGEEAGGDTGVDACEGARAVVFEGELAFEGVDDRFDPLAVTGEGAEPGGFIFAVGADQVRAEFAGDEGFEVAPGEALVAEDDLPGADEVMVTGQQRGHHFAFAQSGWARPQMMGMPSAVVIR